MSTSAWPRRRQLSRYGKVVGSVWKEVLVIENHTNSTTIQYEDERDRSNNFPHKHLQSDVIRTLLPRDQLPRRSKSPCPTLEVAGELGIYMHDIHQQLSKLNLDERIGKVLTKDIRRKSMGITIDDSVKARHSIERAIRTDWIINRSRRGIENRQRSKSRNSKWSVFCTHSRKTDHDVSDFWSIKRKESGRRSERN